jgi:hypothetical protein
MINIFRRKIAKAEIEEPFSPATDDEALLEEARKALSWATVFWNRTMDEERYQQARSAYDKLCKRLNRGELRGPIIIDPSGRWFVERTDPPK